MDSRTKKLTSLAVLASGAIILSYIESLLPPIVSGLPGVKMGLCNVVIIFALFRFGLSSAAAVSGVRLAALALLFGNTLTFLYSFVGATLSLAGMCLLKKTNAFSMVGVSVAGGVLHNFGQILTAILLTNTLEIGYYFAVLAISGTVSGIFIGLLGALVLKQLKNVKI